MLNEDDFTFGDFTDEGVQRHDESWVVMGYPWQWLAHGHLYSELLQQFALQAFIRDLTMADLTAREFPFERQTHGRTSLCSQYLPVIFYDSTGNMQVFHEQSSETSRQQQKNNGR